jgi:hypothetical protein
MDEGWSPESPHLGDGAAQDAHNTRRMLEAIRKVDPDNEFIKLMERRGFFSGSNSQPVHGSDELGSSTPLPKADDCKNSIK